MKKKYYGMVGMLGGGCLEVLWFAFCLGEKGIYYSFGGLELSFAK